MIEIALRDDFSAASLAPFATVIERPETPGARRFFSDFFGADRADCAPVIHTNLNRAQALPFDLATMERHPHAAQAFIPLDVSRYLVTVAPDNGAGAPDLGLLRSFVVPGNLGVIYHRNAWHAPASVLDRDASFVVVMWRGAADGDDVVVPIEPVRLVAAGGGRA